MLVEVRPLPAKKWHGKKGKDAFAQPKTVEVLYNTDKAEYEHGLTAEELEKYSKLLAADLASPFQMDEPHPYWASKASWVQLPNKTLVLNTEKASEYVKVANLKVSKFVANSMKEWEQNLWPDATHVIFSEEEEMEKKATKFQTQQAVMQKLVDMSLEAKIAIVQVLSKDPVKSRSQNFIDGKISELLDEQPAEMLATINLGKEEVTIRATVLELLSSQILTRPNGNSGAVYYMGEQLAFDYEDTVRYFKDPNNAGMKVRLMEKLQK